MAENICRSSQSLNMLRTFVRGPEVPKAHGLTQTGRTNSFRMGSLQGSRKTIEVWCISFSKTSTLDVNNPRMLGWEDSALAVCGAPVPASEVQTSPHCVDFFFFFCTCMSLPGPDPRPFPIPAGIWDTHLIVCFLILAVQVWTDPPFCPCPCVSVSTLRFSLFFFLTLSGKELQWHNNVARRKTVKRCSKTM